MDQKQLKIREKGQNSVTNFQLSKFYRPESTDIKGFSYIGTIEWEGPSIRWKWRHGKICSSILAQHKTD